MELFARITFLALQPFIHLVFTPSNLRCTCECWFEGIAPVVCVWKPSYFREFSVWIKYWWRQIDKITAIENHSITRCHHQPLQILICARPAKFCKFAANFHNKNIFGCGLTLPTLSNQLNKAVVMFTKSLVGTRNSILLVAAVVIVIEFKGLVPSNLLKLKAQCLQNTPEMCGLRLHISNIGLQQQCVFISLSWMASDKLDISDSLIIWLVGLIRGRLLPR